MLSDASLDDIRNEGEAMNIAVAREYYESLAGLKATADLQTIYARHSRVLSDEALALVRRELERACDEGEARRGTRMLLEWQVAERLWRELAKFDEKEIAWGATAAMTLGDGRRVNYQQLVIDIANTPNRGDRLVLDRARSALVAKELAPMRRDRFQHELDFTATLGIANGYVETFVALSGIDVRALAVQCEDFLRATQVIWDEAVRTRVTTKLGITIDEAMRSDALVLTRASEFDAFFPAATLEEVVRRSIREMGLDATAGNRVVFDAGERDGKYFRAFCSPVRIPDEVYLVMRPHGGHRDYGVFMHELGHALHAAFTRKDYPFEYRWLGDKSVTESYAMLFEHLVQDAGWWLRYTSLGKTDVAAFQHAVGFQELLAVRRQCGKLLYELDLYSGANGETELQDRYVRTLDAATSFHHDPTDAFIDVDARLYVTRYLRAWQLQAVLGDALTSRFNEDWYRNPKAGQWIVEELYREGQRENANEIAARVAGQPLSFEPLVLKIESLLRAA